MTLIDSDGFVAAEVLTMMLGVCWKRGSDGGDKVPAPKWGSLQREAWFTAWARHLLLHQAPPDELLALSRAQGK